MILLLFDTAYLALMTNALVTAACAPLVVLLLTTDPGRSWPLIALLGPLAGPALCGAFAVLSAYSQTRSTEVARTFVRVWRASARRSMMLTAGTSALLVVLAVDCRAAWGRPVGALAIPVLVVLMVLAVATTLLALVLLSSRPQLRVRDACRVSVYLAVRHWFLTLLSLFALALLQALLVTRPAIALGVAMAPILYVVWAGSRFSLVPLSAPRGSS
jgi:uncharacterized membrane protein YesL